MNLLANVSFHFTPSDRHWLEVVQYIIQERTMGQFSQRIEFMEIFRTQTHNAKLST